VFLAAPSRRLLPSLPPQSVTGERLRPVPIPDTLDFRKGRAPDALANRGEKSMGTRSLLPIFLGMGVVIALLDFTEHAHQSLGLLAANIAEGLVCGGVVWAVVAGLIGLCSSPRPPASLPPPQDTYPTRESFEKRWDRWRKLMAQENAQPPTPPQ
jgi:hypothetical protein